jgi:hypothetical protein
MGACRNSFLGVFFLFLARIAGVVHANVGHNVTYLTPAPAPPLFFFVPTATYVDLVTSREERHNTTPTGKTGKNTATMVAEPPSSPATWS